MPKRRGCLCELFFPTLTSADKIRVWPFGFKREEKQQQTPLPGSLNRDLNPGAAVSAVTVSLSVVEKTLRHTCLLLQAGQRSEALHVGHYRYILASSDEAVRLIFSCKRSSSRSRMRFCPLLNTTNVPVTQQLLDFWFNGGDGDVIALCTSVNATRPDGFDVNICFFNIYTQS